MSWFGRERKGLASFTMRGVKREEERRRSVFTRRAMLLVRAKMPSLSSAFASSRRQPSQ